MRKIYMTIGLIASGKSTWSKQFVKENKNTYRVSRDDLRFMTTDYDYTPENEKIIDSLYRSIINDLLINTDKDIIFDEMNLDKDRREKFKNWVWSITDKLNQEIEFIEKEFPITCAEAIIRDSKRERPIGKNVIKRVYDKYEIQLKQMLKRHKPKQIIDDKLPWCLICDIDGTLSDSTNRKIFDDSHAIEEIVIEPVRDILFQYASSDIAIFIMSGRKETCREITEQWLEKNNIPYDDLYMRKADDNRDDTIIKRDLYEKYIKGRYNTLFVIDDRPKVCKMWQDLGIFTLVVNQDVYAKNDF